MAKKSSIEKDKKKQEMVMPYKERRDELRAISKKPHVSEEERREARYKLGKLPRNSCPTRVSHRCAVTGRVRGTYRKFGLSRIVFRDMAHAGELPGVKKASW